MWGVQPNDGVAIEGSINDSRGNEWNDDDSNLGDDSAGFFYSRSFRLIHFVCLDDCDFCFLHNGGKCLDSWRVERSFDCFSVPF